MSSQTFNAEVVDAVFRERDQLTALEAVAAWRVRARELGVEVS